MPSKMRCVAKPWRAHNACQGCCRSAQRASESTGASGERGAVGPHAAACVLDLEDIAVEIGNPLPTLDRQLQISDRAPDERFHFAPEEAGILISEVCWRLIAEPLIAADLLEFTEERIELARVERIAQLPDRSAARNKPASLSVSA